MKTTTKRCPTCGQRLVVKKFKRVCRKCKKGLSHSDKWKWVPTNKVGVYALEHWNCKDTESYGRKHFQ